MANDKQKCPMCGTKLKMIDGKMSCKNCGYYIRSQQEFTDYQNETQYNPPTTQPVYQPNPSNAIRQTPKKKSGAGPAIAIVTTITVCLILVIFLIGLFRFSSDYLDEKAALNQSSNQESRSNSLLDYINSSLASNYESSSQGNSSTTPSSSSEGSTTQRRWPVSSFFIQMSEAIWGKGYRTITAEEYASLTALQINRDDKTISYQINNGETQNLTFQTYTGVDLADLAAFSGLEYLSIDDDLSQGDLDGLSHLYAVYAENSIEEYLKIIPHPENILELNVESSFFKNSLEGLDTFPNLQYLSVEYDSLEDISILTQFPNLLGLTLTDCDKLTDYSPLMSLTNLQVLGIESTQLKSIDFIKVMPNLSYLYVEDSKITSLNALSSSPYLTSLTLIDNYSIENDDYSMVSELEMLNDLTICLGHHFNMPSLAKMTELQQLTLKNADNYEALQDAPNLVYLSLTDCSWWDLEPLVSMPQLTTVILNDCHLDSVEPLTRVPNLMALDMEDTNVYSNVEGIFGIPNLYYLNLTDCQVGIDFNNMPYNDALNVLHLNDISILEDPSFSSWDHVEKNISAHYDMFENFPNLTELYMAHTKIDSLDFVENLPYLEYLDITDNNVTSLKPLESLDYLWYVKCAKNTILEGLSENTHIHVDTSD